VTAVLRVSEVSRYHPVLVLIASTGLRKGEALALRWDKVDLEAGVLRVAATIARVDGRLVISEPKTDRSRRSRAAVRRRDAAQAQSPPSPPNGCAPRTNGPTRARCSPPSWAGPSTRATCCT
jgi:integrase